MAGIIYYSELLLGIGPRKTLHDDTFTEGLFPDGDGNEAIELKLKDLLLAFLRRFVFYSLVIVRSNPRPINGPTSLRRELSLSF